MMRLVSRSIVTALVLGGGALGCAHAAVPGAPVTYVPTNTPGLMYVIVHPGFRGNPAGLTLTTGDQVSAFSDYVLLCDGRPATGMRCEIPSEAALERISYTPHPGSGTTPVEDMVGILASPEARIHHEPPEPELHPEHAPPPPPPPTPTKETKEPKGTRTAPPAAPPPTTPTQTPPPGGVK